MKKTLLFSLILVILFSVSSFAVQTTSYVYSETSPVKTSRVENHGLFKKIKKEVKSRINFAKASIKKIKSLNDSLHGINLQTAIILMVLGLIFMIIAGAVHDNGIVWAVGAIFFLIGAIFLLLTFI